MVLACETSLKPHILSIRILKPMFTLKNPSTLFFFFITLLLFLGGHTLRGENLVLWISSFQDQVYYEKMGELSSKRPAKSWISRSRPTVFAKCLIN